MSINIAYFVHDLNDPAVARRVRALTEGGASLRLAGFYRRKAENAVEGAPALPLAQTHDARLARRALAVAGRLIAPDKLRRWIKAQDVIIARNLEVLVLALRVRRGQQKIVYECLDIHRMMFRQDIVGRSLRALERWLLDKVDLVITSSPAFRESYFRKIQDYKGEVLLVENKPLVLDGQSPAPGQRASGPPWRIGWFGMLRCKKSLQILSELSRELAGRVEVLMAGIPARTELKDFESTIERFPGLSYIGPYSQSDLPSLYNQVHFSWCIDFYEQGANSDWLLPCRLYESIGHGTVPLAIEGVEAGSWLREHGIGVRFSDLANQLTSFFSKMNPVEFARLDRGLRRVPRDLLVCDRAECENLVARLAKL